MYVFVPVGYSCVFVSVRVSLVSFLFAYMHPFVCFMCRSIYTYIYVMSFVRVFVRAFVRSRHHRPRGKFVSEEGGEQGRKFLLKKRIQFLSEITPSSNEGSVGAPASPHTRKIDVFPATAILNIPDMYAPQKGYC